MPLRNNKNREGNYGGKVKYRALLLRSFALPQSYCRTLRVTKTGGGGGGNYDGKVKYRVCTPEEFRLAPVLLPNAASHQNREGNYGGKVKYRVSTPEEFRLAPVLLPNAASHQNRGGGGGGEITTAR